jgi:dolichol-phosphate mannosyltransferase
MASVAPRILLYPRLGKVNDIASGFFLVRREAVAWQRLRPRGFKILLEILARSPGLRATEAPYRFEERVAGESKASLREGVRFGRQLLGLFASEPEAGRPWKFFIVGASGLGVNALAFAAATAAGANAFGAWAAGVETSILTNFTLNALFTFRDREVFRAPLPALKSVALYHLATSAGIAVNAALFAALVHASAIPPLVSALVSATAGAITNYLLANRVAFARQRLAHVLPVIPDEPG